MLTLEIAILFLLLVACLSAVAFKPLHFPYTVGLVIIGFGLGLLQQVGLSVESLKEVVLSPDLILYLFVPPLIFESALNLEDRLLVRNLPPILMLAGPGLVVSMLIVAALMAWLTPLSWGSALLFGALISATDPVAVIALFKEVGVAKRLTVLVEGESMLNDATAIVAFELVLLVLTAGALESTTSDVLVNVTVVLLGGLVVGWVTGTLLGYAMMLAQDDGLIQATVSVIIAYMTFIIAEHFLHVSGVIAVMTAGLVLGRYKSRRLRPKRRTFFHDFWEYAAFLANSLIFLLVGLSAASFVDRFQAIAPVDFWLTLVLAIVAVLVGRAVIVFSLVPPLNRFLKDGPVNWRYQTVMFWGGLRGAIALALVLSLDTSFADRNLLIALTLGVALFTIIACGTTIDKLIHRLRLDEPSIVERLAEAEAVFLARQETLNTINDVKRQEPIQDWVLDELKAHHQAALNQAQDALRDLWTEPDLTPELEQRALWLQALSLEQQGYQHFFDRRLIAERTLSKLQLLLELKREALLAGRIPPPVVAYEELEAEWEKMLPGVMDPNSPAGEMLRDIIQEQTTNWLEKQRHLEILRGQYEYDMAIFTVAEEVAQRIDDLSRQQCVASSVADECARFYRYTRAQALLRLQNVAEQKPKLVLDLQRHILHQSALERAETLLENLAERGILSASAAQKARVTLRMDKGREEPGAVPPSLG